MYIYLFLKIELIARKSSKIICFQVYIVRQYIKVQRLANKYYVILIKN